MTWAALPGERGVMYSPIGFRLVDDFTTREPLGRTTISIEMMVAPNVFVPADIRTRITPSAIIVFPALERRRDASAAQPRRYRMKIQAELYAPFYQGTLNGDAGGIHFNAFPYNDDVAPAIDPICLDVALLPAVNYPFESQYPVLHGLVVDNTGKAVPAALVSHNAERVFADSRGAFSIAIRWENTTAKLLAEDLLTARHGEKDVDLTDPAQRDRNVTIQFQP